jgi:hypothetical protein
MRYLTLIGFVICRFSFAQIATSPMSLSNAPTTFLPQQLNTQPIQLNSSEGSIISLSNEWMVAGTDLRNTQISFAKQFNNSKLSANFNHDGSVDLSNNTLALNLAKKISSQIHLGVGFNGQIANTSVDQNFQLGYNLFGSYQLNKTATFCLWYQQLGTKTYQSIAYNFVTNNTIVTGAIALTEYSPVLEIGSNYKMNNKIILGAMLSNGPYPFGLNINYLSNQWAITFKTTYHQNQLGFRPSIYIHYAFKEQKSGGGNVGMDDVHKPLRSN